MRNKDIKKKRMMGYFIDATNKIIEEQGVEEVTIRKVADLAGYNSATLYNYFKNLNHLVFFSSMKYLMYYSFSLPSYLKGAKTPKEKFLKIWECFLYYSYNNPTIFYNIFFNEFSDNLSMTMNEYYDIYPEELSEEFTDLIPMITDGDIYERNKFVLDQCVVSGYISEEDEAKLNDMILLVYQGMLIRVKNKQVTYSTHEAVGITLDYIIHLFESYEQEK